MITDTRTGLPVGDPKVSPFPAGYEFTKTNLDFSSFILSASGWRKVFSSDGNEESCVLSISVDDRERIVLVGTVLSDFFRRKHGGRTPCIAVGLDTRYTGPSIADVIVRTLLAYGIEVRYLFIAAAPEIMAYVKTSSSVDGFVYVSASHNPVGHNGLKFGLSDGAVLGGEDSAALIAELLDAARTARGVREAVDAVRSLDPERVGEVYDAFPAYKAQALEAYRVFTLSVVTGSAGDPGALVDAMKASFEENPVGVVADMNGSARTVSIDRECIERFGVRFDAVNSLPRQIVHRIVPEGESLLPCARFLERKHASDPAFVFGYLPDNDGDRGNLVYIGRNGKARTLEAQEVFALACVAELSWLVYSGAVHYDADGKVGERIALVVNDPTSCRIDRIADAFDAKVFRAEVGEANVVSLAADLRSRGWIVRILGEGSNGGNITHPSTVRDPLDTVFSIRTLLPIRSRAGRMGPFDIWRRRAGLRAEAAEGFSLPDIIDSLPAFTTTSAFEDRAKLAIGTTDHAMLKSRYESLFLSEWDERKDYLRERFGFQFHEEIVYRGTSETRGTGLTARSGKGGYKVLFKDSNGRQKAFLWMRGSGTEPVFRIMVDLEGDDPEGERYLLDWHRSMIVKADSPV